MNRDIIKNEDNENDPLFRSFISYLEDKKQLHFTWKCFCKDQGPIRVIYFVWPTYFYNEHVKSQMLDLGLIVEEKINQTFYVNPEKSNLSTAHFIKTTLLKPIAIDIIYSWYEKVSQTHPVENLSFMSFGFVLNVNKQRYIDLINNVQQHNEEDETTKYKREGDNNNEQPTQSFSKKRKLDIMSSSLPSSSSSSSRAESPKYNNNNKNNNNTKIGTQRFLKSPLNEENDEDENYHRIFNNKI